MRQIRLHRVGWLVAGPGLAWCDTDDQGVGHVYLRRGADKVLHGLERVGHELEHLLVGFGNEGHHPLDHLCLRSTWPLRSWKCAEVATPELARRLLRDGVLEVP